MKNRLTGLIAAVHTPMHDDGSLWIEQVEQQFTHLLKSGVDGVFVGGTTGESLSLTMEERMALTSRWTEVARDTDMKVLVHVGHNSLPAARALADHAGQFGAWGIAAMAPCFFKPRDLSELISFLEGVATVVPALPFYYYDIPALTGVNLSMTDFLAQGRARLPNLAGIKYTNDDLAQFLECIQFDKGAYDILFGCDEALLAGLALGAKGAVGSSYNFAAPLYQRIISAYNTGDLDAARADQQRSAGIIRVLKGYGYSAAAKAVMAMKGVDCGPVRPPLKRLSEEQIQSLRQDLDLIGFFE